MDEEKPKRKKKNVFDNEQVETLAHQFRKNLDFPTYQAICEGSNNLMDAIIRSNGFDKKVPFSDLKNSLFLQVENWLMKWVPEEGKLYTYFSVCIRNGCLSIINKEKLFNERFAVTDVPLDSLTDQEHQSSKVPSAVIETLTRSAENIYCRWSEPVIQEVLRYMVSCVLRGRGDRRPQILRTAMLGWPIQLDTARFLLDWSHGAVRKAILEHYHQPMGEVDIIRAAQKFSTIPDIIEVIGLENTCLLLNTFAGQSVRFPSFQQIRKWQESVAIYESMTDDPTPENVKLLGRKYRKSPAKIQEAYEAIVDNINAGVLEDVQLYPTRDSLPRLRD